MTIDELTALHAAAKQEFRDARARLDFVEFEIMACLEEAGQSSAYTACGTVSLRNRYEWLPDADRLLRPALEHLSPQDRERLIAHVTTPKIDGTVALKLTRMGGQPAEIVDSARRLVSRHIEVKAPKAEAAS